MYLLYRENKKEDIRLIPSIIGGSEEHRHRIVLAKSIPAKKYNIQTGESIMEARKKFSQLSPGQELRVISPDYDLFDRCSRAFMKIVNEFSPVVQQYSIDEAYLDMTGIPGDPVETATRLKSRIRDELGFTVNVGVSSNKILAKMAGELKKPDLVHTLWPEEIQEKMWNLAVNELFFLWTGHY